MPNPFKRIMIKLSGEFLAGTNSHGIDPVILSKTINEIQIAVNNDVQIAITIGGGNFFRGLQGTNDLLDRVSADHMGMMATIMNAIALRSSCKQMNIPAEALSMAGVNKIIAEYDVNNALDILDAGKILIIACGTGRAFATTDSAAIINALELQCDAVIKATKVDGIFNKDPVKHADALFTAKLSYDDVIKNDIRVMDQNAVITAKENNLPILVMKIGENNLTKVIAGDDSVQYSIVQ